MVFVDTSTHKERTSKTASKEFCGIAIGAMPSEISYLPSLKLQLAWACACFDDGKETPISFAFSLDGVGHM